MPSLCASARWWKADKDVEPCALAQNWGRGDSGSTAFSKGPRSLLHCPFTLSFILKLPLLVLDLQTQCLTHD